MVVWDTETAKQTNTIRAHLGHNVSCVTVEPLAMGSSVVVSGASDGTVRMSDTRCQGPCWQYQLPSGITDAVWRKHSGEVAFSCDDGIIQVLDAKRGDAHGVTLDMQFQKRYDATAAY